MSVNYAFVVVGFQQAIIDVEVGSVVDFFGIEQGVVRGVIVDVDIQYSIQSLFRKGLCFGFVIGDYGFEVRFGVGNDKIVQRLRERYYRRASIAGFRVFIGDDDGIRINVFRFNIRSMILFEY